MKGEGITSGLNASRGALYRLNFCAKFGFGSRINGSAKIPCLRQAATTLNKPYVYLHDNQVNIIQYGIVFAWMFIKKYHENTS